ncbi:MAG TPA: NAD(+)/NADH kinase, partial [Hyphomicrobiaceae bacterium]|nr:NAD(+)/NADH kinase [Hyphomicrobiaceae bacterium]
MHRPEPDRRYLSCGFRTLERASCRTRRRVPAGLTAVVHRVDPRMPETHRTFERIAFVASDASEARLALERLTATYGNAAPESADAIVALGGDGLMLQTLHRFMGDRIPIYGMNRGSVGFLMN